MESLGYLQLRKPMMPQFEKLNRVVATIALLAAGLFFAMPMAAQAPPQGAPPPAGGTATNPVIPENSVIKISDHVYAIVAFPNIGFVVGDRSILVVDTGLGPRNGAVVAKEAAKLAPNHTLYLTTTHFHPEHAAGDAGFPSSAILVRPAVQQKELEDDQNAMVNMFSGRSAQNKELLQDVKFRKPDILFDKEITLDLGGVTARLFWMGVAHTQGDEMIFVDPDKTLLPGDIVMSKTLPNLFGPNARLNSWINILDQLRSLQALHVVPDHGSLGDGTLVTQEYAFLSDLQSRALDLKRQGKSAADAGQTILAEFKTKYADWPNLKGIPGLVTHVYSENP
jgi:glyoxylase-like metal-dependent hydrolase (beta-lactamase superfamily II)